MAAERVKGKRPAKRATKRQPAKAAREFYASALDSADRIELDQAAEIEGLDGEIAVLRVKLRAALAEHPEDKQLMMRGIELLVKAVTARYRLSKQAQEDLSESIDGVIRGVGGALMPEVFGDG